MKITPLTTLRTGEPGAYKWITPGSPASLPDLEAAYLVAKGLATSTGGSQQRSRQPAPNQITDASLIDAIVDTIAELQPDAFGKDGKPGVKAIEEILEQSITASDRDKAWEIYRSLADDDA